MCVVDMLGSNSPAVGRFHGGDIHALYKPKYCPAMYEHNDISHTEPDMLIDASVIRCSIL